MSLNLKIWMIFLPGEGTFFTQRGFTRYDCPWPAFNRQTWPFAAYYRIIAQTFNDPI